MLITSTSVNWFIIHLILLALRFTHSDGFVYPVYRHLRNPTYEDYSLRLLALPSFHWPVSLFPSYKQKKPALSPSRVVNDSSTFVTIREVTSREELRVCCNLCVDAFFGAERSLFHDWKLKRIRSELKDLLLYRYDNPTNFDDKYILAESSYLHDYVVNRPLPLWPGYVPDDFIVGFVLLSKISANDKSFSQVNWTERFASNTTVIPKITNLSVDRGCRGLGIGMALLKACSSFASRQGFQLLTLEVEADNAAAIKLYRKAGFEEICTQFIPMYDTRSLFLRNIRKKSIVMVKSLPSEQ